MNGHKGSGGRAACGEFFKNQAGIKASEAHASKLFRCVDRKETQLTGTANDINGKVAFQIPAGSIGRKLLTGKVPCGILKSNLL